MALTALLTIIAIPRIVAADALSLAWDANREPNVTGYVVHVGTQPGVYTQSYDVGATTAFVFSNAVPGQRYCFAASAYVAGPILSPKSSEVCGFSNRFPTLAPPGVQSTPVGQPVTLQLDGEDPEEVPVTYSATGLPSGLSLMASTGFISGTPTSAGTTTVTVRASDGVLTTTTLFTWTVTPPLTFVALTPDRTSPQAEGSTITFSASVSGGTSPYQYRWWVHDGTAWHVVREWSTSNTFAWTPSSASPAYRVNVWVRNATTTTDVADVSGSMPFAIASSRPPLQATLTVNRAAPQPAGTTMTFAATATGGKAPYQYRWWVYDGTRWVMVRDWSTGATFAWTPTSADSAYRVNVWVRNADSTADAADASGSLPFAITASTALQASLSANLAAPQQVGSTITFTVAATGGKAPYQYRWWVYDGTAWQVVREWSTANTFAWAPTSPNATYRVNVWVRNADTTTDTWDASGAMSFGISQ